MEAIRKKIQDELKELENELRFKLPKEIQLAREFGDLKENAEYKAALERQKMVKARVVQLSQRLVEVESFTKEVTALVEQLGVPVFSRTDGIPGGRSSSTAASAAGDSLPPGRVARHPNSGPPRTICAYH